jgi:hypothetical protein
MKNITYKEFINLLRDNNIYLYADEDYEKYKDSYYDYLLCEDLNIVIKNINAIENLDRGLVPFKDFISATRKEINEFQITDPLTSDHIINKIKKMFEEHPVETEIDLEFGKVIKEMADEYVENLCNGTKSHIHNYEILCKILEDVEKAVNVLKEVKPKDWKGDAIKKLISAKEDIISLVADELSGLNFDVKQLSFYAKKIEDLDKLVNGLTFNDDLI